MKSCLWKGLKMLNKEQVYDFFVEMNSSTGARKEALFDNFLEEYKYLLLKYSTVDGKFDEDLYQEQLACFYKCVLVFSKKLDM